MSEFLREPLRRSDPEADKDHEGHPAPMEAVRVAQLEEAWELVALQQDLIRRVDRRDRRRAHRRRRRHRRHRG